MTEFEQTMIDFFAVLAAWAAHPWGVNSWQPEPLPQYPSRRAIVEYGLDPRYG